MNFAIKIFEGFAAMPDHWSRKRSHGFFRNFDWAGNEKFLVLNHEVNLQRLASEVQHPTRKKPGRAQTETALFFLDEANVTAAFHPCDLYARDILQFGVKPQIFLQIMLGNMVPSHRIDDEITIFHNSLRSSFDKNTKRVRMISDKGKKPVDQNDHHTAAQGRKKCGAPVDGA